MTEWMKKNGAQDTVVFAAKPHVPVLANARWVDFREHKMHRTPLQRLPSILKNIRPDYVIYDDRYAGRQYSNLRALRSHILNPHLRDLKPVFRHDGPKAIVIYEYSGRPR